VAKRKATQKQAHCLWCGRPGASNEDVIPRWVAKLYPETGWWTHEHAHPDHDYFKSKRAKGPAAISRKFCQRCNNGWMSRLEQSAEPILTEMIHGNPSRLDTDQQRLISFWICKTTLAFDSMEPVDRRVMPVDLYSALYREEGPIARCQVWLARREASPSVAWHRAHLLSRVDSPEQSVGSVLAMGQMVAHVAWHPEGATNIELSRRFAATLTQIWPIRRESRLWPPIRQLENGEDLSWLAKDLALDAEPAVA
jgi:hypothetical protein